MLAVLARELDKCVIDQPAKNGPLLTEYLAGGQSERFLMLVRKYRLDLEQLERSLADDSGA